MPTVHDNKSWTFLNKMTKEEIISFLNQACYFNAPTMKQVQFFIYDRRTDRLLKEHKKWMDENHPKMHALAQEIDKLGTEYNKLNDDRIENRFQKQLKIWNQRSKLRDELTKLREESNAYDKKYQACEIAWAKYKEVNDVD